MINKFCCIIFGVNLIEFEDGSLAMAGGRYRGQTQIWYRRTYKTANDGGGSYLKLMKLDHSVVHPNNNVDTCRAACDKDPDCLYMYIGKVVVI